MNEKTKTSSATDECAAHTSEGVDCVRLSGGGYGRCLVTSKNGTFVGPSYTHAMSRVAAIYDIHGNLPALEAVLDEVRAAHVDIVVVGGDLVPGPMPRETVARVRSIDVPVFFIQGNGDREVVACRRGASNRRLPEPVQDVLGWSAEQLTPEDVAFMAGWPASKDLPVAGLGRVMFCHATLRNDTEIFTRDTPEAEVLPMFPAAVADVIVCGHTHMQFDRPAGGRRIVNAGSVGMPFGEPGAYWLLLDSSVQLRRTAFDLAAAADRIRATSYPQAAVFASGNVLQPPSEAEMLAAFRPKTEGPG